MPAIEEDPEKRRRREEPEMKSGPTDAISVQAGPQAPLQQQQQQQRAQPTNFTNFARRFNANKDVATREAGKYANQATTAAGKAAGSLQAAQTQFANGVNTGSVAPPPGSNAPAATNVGGAAPPPTSAIAATPAALPPAQPSGQTSQALEGESTRPGGGMTMADMLAKAGEQYTGPMGLDTTQAIPDALAAQEQLDLLKDGNGVGTLVNESGQSGTQGADALSGSLIGAAGRQNFDALRAKFNPNKDLNDAQDKAIKTAEEARKKSEENASGWGKAADAKGVSDEQEAAYGAAKTKADAEKADAADKANVPLKSYESTYAAGVGGSGDTGENRRAYMMSGVDQKNPAAVKKRQEEIAAYQKASATTMQNDMDSTFNDINSYMSPSVILQQAGGGKDATQSAAQKQYNGGGTASQSGSTDNNVIPWGKVGADGFFVWRSMTPDDWKTINGLNGNSQRKWIDDRAQQLRNMAANKPKTSSQTSY